MRQVLNNFFLKLMAGWHGHPHFYQQEREVHMRGVQISNAKLRLPPVFNLAKR